MTDGATAPSAELVAARRGLVAGHLRVPLYRNAYALIAGTVVTTVLGLVFWVVASRLFGVEAVGRAQTGINALILLAGLGSLRLLSPLIRFLPGAGERAGRLLTGSYLAAAAGSVVVGVLYVAGVRGDRGVGWFLGDGVVPAAAMVASIVVWNLFTLQDGALVGLRAAPWVLVKNGAYGVAKLVLLVAAAAAGASGVGIFVAWVVPALVAVVFVHRLIVRRLLPLERVSAPVGEPVALREVARYTGADYVGMLSELAVVNLVPLVVAHELGLEAVGYFGPVWMIGTMLDHVLVHYGSSLTVEGAAEPRRLAPLSVGLLRRSLLLVVPIVVVCAVGAPLLVSVFGPGYAERTAEVLQLCALALLPRLVVHVVLVGARIRQQIARVMGIQVALAALTFAVMLPTLDRWGFEAAGVGYLVASVVVALAVLPTLVATHREASRC